MLNNIMLVGRLTEEVEIKELENGKKLFNAKLAVNRSFKNVDGIYEIDIIPIIIWEGLGNKMVEYCHKDDLIGIRGRIQMDNDQLQLIAEKVTFLSSNKNILEKESEENND